MVKTSIQGFKIPKRDISHMVNISFGGNVNSTTLLPDYSAKVQHSQLIIVIIPH